MTDAQTASVADGAHRELAFKTAGMPAQDGDGVSLRRIIGTPELDMVDPFLLFDFFGSDEPQHYIGGFPDHPHRGFETVTYMLAGRSRHKDSAGHEGVIEAGDVQWMTAGSGIIHSEMPEQEEGRLAGFQLWVNLPAAQKMIDPAYQEVKGEAIPVERFDGGSAKVIAGKATGGTVGPVINEWTDPIYFDMTLDDGGHYVQEIADSHNAFIYVLDGALELGGGADTLAAGELGVLTERGAVDLTGRGAATRFILVAGRRIGEPVARGGPFVMTTKEEVLQAFEDFRGNRFARTGAF